MKNNKETNNKSDALSKTDKLLLLIMTIMVALLTPALLHRYHNEIK